jgi:flagellar basal-body rod modification protein FlgD
MTTVNSATGANGAQTADTSAVTKLSADYNMFLKLLTAQMQNQDPMNPTDTSQYTQQLVQYSQVEQSIQQNTTLKSILSSLGTQSLAQFTPMIGHSVETNSGVSGVSATQPGQWTWTAARDVTSMVATITDDKGRTVDTRTIDVKGATGSFSWNGTTAGGRQLPDGNYQVSFAGADSSGSQVAVTPHAYGTVSDVQLKDGAVLVTVNGMQVSAADLVRIG